MQCPLSDMGSALSLSRSKKVAPVCVVEINVSKRQTESPEENVAPAATITGEVRNSKRFKIPNFTKKTHFSQVDCERRGSPRLTEGDEERGGPDRALAGCDEDQVNTFKMKSGPKKSFVRSRTYGLCNFKRVRSDTRLNPATTPAAQAFAASELHGQECGLQDVNKNGNSVFSHSDHEHRSFQGMGPSRTCVEQVPNTGNDSSYANCLNTPVATTVTLYDGSEEELINTIERDFS